MVEIIKLTESEWKELATNAHLAVFNEKKDHSKDNISYALLSKKDGELTGYVTVREIDDKTVYWQFGGALPGTKGTVKVMESYKAFIYWTKLQYKRITTFVLNTNIPYLRLAMANGFLISGMKCFKNTLLVELTLEFEGEI